MRKRRFTGGARLDEGVQVELGKDRVGEKMSRDFYELGLGKGVPR